MKLLIQLQFILSIFLGLFSFSAMAEDYLGADAIKSLVSGKTVYAQHLKKDFEFKVYFDSDGKTAIRQQGGDDTETTYSFDGDKHCIYWNGKDRCANILDIGDGMYMRVNKKGKQIIKWYKIVDGKDL